MDTHIEIISFSSRIYIFAILIPHSQGSWVSKSAEGIYTQPGKKKVHEKKIPLSFHVLVIS